MIRSLLLVISMCCVTAMLWPTPTYAGPPFGDPAFRSPLGGGVAAPNTDAVAPAPVLAPLPIPAPRPAANPSAQPLPPSPASLTGPLFWANQTGQVGKWAANLLISGPAILALSLAAPVAALEPLMEQHVFGTSRQLTTAAPERAGAPVVVSRVIATAATAVLIVVAMFRLYGLLINYNRRVAIDIATQTIGGLVMINAAWTVCDIIIAFANQLSTAVITVAFGSLSLFDPFQYTQTLAMPGINGALALTTLLYYALLAVLFFQAFRRIVLVNLMLIISPLAGLAFATGGTWNYGRVWFFRFIELLMIPIIWAAALGFTQYLVNSWTVAFVFPDEIGRSMVNMLLAAFAYLVVLEAPALIGLAAREAVSGGGGAMRVVTTAIRVITK